MAQGPVLIVDDERDLRTLLDFNLRQAGFSTAQAVTGAEAIAQARKLRPQAIVLDLNLPDIAGTDVCRLLRGQPETREIPILMLTARGAETDRIQGLELGADDYVTKPFSMREVVLRVGALIRRGTLSSERKDEEPLRLGGIEIDRRLHEVRVDGKKVALTLQEFRLLAYLMESPGRVRSRDEILVDVWDASPDLETRTIDTHIKRLRDKIGSTGDLIETVRGLGYRIRSPGD